jgi:ABC-type sugar transport system ATPase subunit
VDSIRDGIAFITEDRQRLGLMLHASVTENITLVGLGSKIKGFFINPKRHGTLIQHLVESLRIKTPSLQSEVIYLSGGNQQKVVLAKWLYTEQEIYILDEPTRGIDANAKTEFYRLMSRLTKEGKAILLVSSDMPELISMSDRVLVVRSGGITGELKGADINEHEIVKKALGVANA